MHRSASRPTCPSDPTWVPGGRGAWSSVHTGFTQRSRDAPARIAPGRTPGCATGVRASHPVGTWASARTDVGHRLDGPGRRIRLGPELQNLFHVSQLGFGLPFRYNSPMWGACRYPRLDDGSVD